MERMRKEVAKEKKKRNENERKKEKGKTTVGLEWGPLSLVSTTEELLNRKVAAPV
jgi:hypothetical protein